MNESCKQSWSRIGLLLGIIVGIIIGFWIGQRENAAILSRQISIDAQKQMSHHFNGEMRYMEMMSEEWDHTNSYWDSKPEIARALLERDLRTEQKVLDAFKRVAISNELGDGRSKDILVEQQLKEISTTHMRIALLCQKLNDAGCVAHHVAEVMRLQNSPSNEVYAAMTKLEASDTAHRRTPVTYY
jgi:hypothetical protein